jgi:DNA-directed RNA polymerase specialized sigma24 family protein
LIKEIELYIVKNYKELEKICVKITDNNGWAQDLLQDVLLQLYEKDEIKLDKLDDDSIKFYIVRCITTNWYSETSPFYRKVRRESSLYNELKDITDLPVEEDNKMDERFMKIVEEEFGGLGWFHKDIFSRWLVLGSHRRVAKQTKIPVTSIGTYIREAKETVKLNVFKRIKDE